MTGTPQGAPDPRSPLRFDQRAALIALPLAALAPFAGRPGWLLWLLAALGLLRATRFALDHPEPWVRRLHRYLTALALGVAAASLWSLGRGLDEAAAGTLMAGTLLGAALYLLLDRMARVRAADRGGVRLSVCVICCDEADRIRGLLDSVSDWADEIVVVDSGSTDDTVRIAREYTDIVQETDWPGYGAQRRRAQTLATGDWVLHLDADERLPLETRAEIDLNLSDERVPDAIAMRWATAFEGGYTAFGYDASPHVRLFRRTEDAGFDEAEVHERARFPGKARLLRGWVLHESWRDRAHMRAKLDAYAALQTGKRGGGLPALRAFLSFLRNYVLRLGFADGWRGRVMAWEYARYTAKKHGSRD